MSTSKTALVYVKFTITSAGKKSRNFSQTTLLTKKFEILTLNAEQFIYTILIILKMQELNCVRKLARLNPKSPLMKGK